MQGTAERGSAHSLTPFDLTRPKAGFGHFPRFAGEAWPVLHPAHARGAAGADEEVGQGPDEGVDAVGAGAAGLG